MSETPIRKGSKWRCQVTRAGNRRDERSQTWVAVVTYAGPSTVRWQWDWYTGMEEWDDSRSRFLRDFRPVDGASDA